MKTADIQWLSGLLEGEGYFGNSKQNMMVAVDMTDFDVMQRVASLLGCNLWGPYNNGPLGRKSKWRAQVAGNRAAGWMMTLYGQLGSRRRARIRELLAIWRTRRSGSKGKTHCLNGHPLSKDNLLDTNDGKRRCKTCARIQVAERRKRIRLDSSNQEQILLRKLG